MSKPALTWNLHLPDMSVDRKKGADWMIFAKIEVA